MADSFPELPPPFGEGMGVSFFRYVHIGCKCQSEMVVESDLLVFNLVAERESLVPLLSKIQFLIHIIIVICFLCVDSYECRKSSIADKNTFFISLLFNFWLQSYEESIEVNLPLLSGKITILRILFLKELARSLSRCTFEDPREMLGIFKAKALQMSLRYSCR